MSGMDRQAVFNRVRKHLLTQGVRSVAPDLLGRPFCAYRGTVGRMCAIGALIDDKHYSPHLEKRGPGAVSVCEALSASGVVYNRGDASTVVNADLSLLSDLQALHDTREPSDWASALREIARHHGLVCADNDTGEIGDGAHG